MLRAGFGAGAAGSGERHEHPPPRAVSHARAVRGRADRSTIPSGVAGSSARRERAASAGRRAGRLRRLHHRAGRRLARRQRGREDRREGDQQTAEMSERRGHRALPRIRRHASVIERSRHSVYGCCRSEARRARPGPVDRRGGDARAAGLYEFARSAPYNPGSLTASRAPLRERRSIRTPAFSPGRRAPTRARGMIRSRWSRPTTGPYRRATRRPSRLTSWPSITPLSCRRQFPCKSFRRARRSSSASRASPPTPTGRRRRSRIARRLIRHVGGSLLTATSISIE